MKKYDDNTPMPFGMHKGTKLANVPADYLLYLWANGLSDPLLKAYIKENYAILKDEL